MSLRWQNILFTQAFPSGQVSKKEFQQIYAEQFPHGNSNEVYMLRFLWHNTDRDIIFQQMVKNLEKQISQLRLFLCIHFGHPNISCNQQILKTFTFSVCRQCVQNVWQGWRPEVRFPRVHDGTEHHRPGGTQGPTAVGVRHVRSGRQWAHLNARMHRCCQGKEGKSNIHFRLILGHAQNNLFLFYPSQRQATIVRHTHLHLRTTFSCSRVSWECIILPRTWINPRRTSQ